MKLSEHYAFPFKENLKFDSITVFRKQGPKQTLNNSSKRAFQCFKPIYLFWKGSPQFLELPRLSIKERLLIEMLNWPPWITAPANSDAMLINMRTNKVSGIEVDHSAKRHSVELCFGVCVFAFLAFDEFLPWRNICNAWTALSRSHDLKGTTELRVFRCFVHSSLAWEAVLKGGKTDTIFFTSEKFRLRPVIGRTIFFTSDKNRPTNQVRSSYWRTIFIWHLCLE